MIKSLIVKEWPAQDVMNKATTSKRNVNDIRIAIIDDHPNIGKLIATYIRKIGCSPTVFNDSRKFVDDFQPDQFDIVITDIRMPDTDGFQVLDKVKRTSPGTDVIVVSAHTEKADAIRALRMGAFDFFEKPVSYAELASAIEKTLAFRELTRERDEMAIDLETAFRENSEKWGLNSFVGNSRSLNAIKKTVQKACSAKAPVLIVGESGTGKELVARMLHYSGTRASKPFVPVNCSAMPAELAESLLFGHVKGAFTGANTAAKGFFEAADKGTLFLDEVGDMRYELQAKLLRVLEDGIIATVGKASGGIPVDVRVVAATNVDLNKKVEEKEFREDLFYRLNTLIIRIPPLRERKDDIPIIINSLITRIAGSMGRSAPGIQEQLVTQLSTLPWPGNVRQLKNALEKALILNSSEILKTDDFQDLFDAKDSQTSARKTGNTQLATIDDDLNLDRIQMQAVKKAMETCRDNMSEASRLLGISRNKLYRLLAKR